MACPCPSPNRSPQAQPTFRLPKLSYRTNYSDVESIRTVSIDASRITTSTNLTSPVQSTFCPSPREPPAEMLGASSPRASSFTPSSIAPRAHKQPPKKRPGFFTGLFNAKEPSAQALADYEKQLLKPGRGHRCTVGIPGVSSAKLPPTVPKVNSKWDGVPETQKEKEKQKQESRQSLMGSRGSSAARSAGSDRRSISTPASQKRLSRGTLGGMSTHSGSANRLAELYGWEIDLLPISSSSSAIVDFAAEHRPTSRLQTSHSAPSPLERPPPLDRSFLFPPHPPSQHSAATPPPFELSPPMLPSSPTVPSHSNSPALTPIETSPITPGTPPTKLYFPSPEPTASLHSKTSQMDIIKTTVIDAPTSVDEVVIRSAGLNILGPPASAKRRGKVSPYQSTDSRPKTSGSDMPLTSILKRDPKNSNSVSGSHTSAAEPIASITPVRRNSARDRLGLGMSLKNQAVAPWSSLDGANQDPIGGNQKSTSTVDGGLPSRKRRMSMFRK